MVVWGGIDNDRQSPPLEIFEVGSVEPYWYKAPMEPGGAEPAGRVGHTMMLLDFNAMVLFGGVEIDPGSGRTTEYHNSIWILQLPPAATCIRSTWAEALIGGNETQLPCSRVSTAPTRYSKDGDCVPANGCELLALPHSMPGIAHRQCVDLCLGKGYHSCPDPGCQWRSSGVYSWHPIRLELHSGYPFQPSPRAFHTAFVADGILTIYGGAIVSGQDGKWAEGGDSTLLQGDDGIWEFRPVWHQTTNGTWAEMGEWTNETRIGTQRYEEPGQIGTRVWPPTHVFHTDTQLGGWNAKKEGAMVVWGGAQCESD